MLNRLLSALALATIGVVWGFAFALNETPVTANQDEAARVTAQPVAAPSLTRPEPPLEWRMHALERHVRSGTILYTGRFGDREWPPRPRVDALALTVGAGSR